MKQVIDNFSSGGGNYARFRPETPVHFFDELFPLVRGFDTAWDCGTGNGQVAAKLAERFGKVFASDISAEQLAHAPTRSNITYLHERAEQTSIPESSVDLITVAQAIHWFDFEAFYDEVRRVATDQCLLAVWTYSLLEVSPAVDAVIRHFHYDITGPYWDAERRYVDEEYRSIPFPFVDIPFPKVVISRKMTLDELTGYLATWSGVKHYIKQKGSNPIDVIKDELATAWGIPEAYDIRWPLHVRAGYVNG